MTSTNRIGLNIWARNWKTEWKNISFRIRLVLTFIILILTISSLTRFLDWVETRPGAVLPDPILRLFNPQDFTWITFLIIYVAVLAGLIYLSQNPKQLLLAIQAYILLVLIRIASMYLIPLEAPATLIPLQDPFVQYFSSGVLTKDLFFSGHTSILFLLYLCSADRWMKILFLLCTILVGFFILWQHVHYSIDVLVAPFYSYTCYRLSLFINRRIDD